MKLTIILNFILKHIKLLTWTKVNREWRWRSAEYVHHNRKLNIPTES